MLVGVLGLWLATAGQAVAACDTASTDDCDEDGCPRFGGSCEDCDDEDPTARPGRAEVCYDQVDNNCDGFVDEACDQGVIQGQISGGGGCTGGRNLGEAALLVWLPWLRRRRS